MDVISTISKRFHPLDRHFLLNLEVPANISSLKLITFDALLMPPLVMWKILSNISGWP